MSDKDAKPKSTAVAKTQPSDKPKGVGGAPLGVPARRPQSSRRRWLFVSFLLLCVFPTLIGGFYYAFVASDRYAAGAGFAVRGVDGGGGSDVLTSLTGMAGSGSTASDSYIILRYLKSRDLIERLNKEFDLRAEYEQKDVDLLSRLWPDATAEEFVDYWERRLLTTFDPTSGIITFEVQAFSAETTQQIADLVLDQVRDLVNSLATSARADSEHFAKQEVARAENRLRDVQVQLRLFRMRENSINPMTGAELEAQMLIELESNLVNLRTRIATLQGTVEEGTPALVRLQRQEKSLAEQIEDRRAAISGIGQDGAGVASVMENFESLVIESTIAQQNYASALSSLESARIEAARQHRYLAVYSQPLRPQEPIYPRRLRNTLLIAVISFGIWAIGTLAVYAVRDHMS